MSSGRSPLGTEWLRSSWLFRVVRRELPLRSGRTVGCPERLHVGRHVRPGKPRGKKTLNARTPHAMEATRS
jgi:hypothetical protein